MRFPTLTAITLAAALAAVPAFAQNTTPPANASGTATVNTKDNNTNAAVTTNAGPGKQADVTVATPPATTAAPGPAPAATVSNDRIGTATVATANNNNATKANAGANNANALPHQRNPVLADNGQPRAGKIIGSDVYNMQDKKVGSVDDILMGVGGQPDQAVISVKNKLVLVPFDKLIFGNTQVTGDNRVIMPDETRDALAQQPEFHYNGQNQNKG
jgi:hypothetical protein